MKYIVLDTETSGLMDYERAAEAEGQPRVAEVALIYLDDDLNVEREYKAYVMPAGKWSMEPGATAINGLTDDLLNERGILIEHVLEVYSAAILEGRAVIAFGAQFDCKMMRAELRRLEAERAKAEDRPVDDSAALFEQTANICVMRSLMSHAKKTGRWLYKYDENGEILRTKKGEPAGGMPKLSDACRYYNIPVIAKEQHGALADARLAMQVFKGMVAEGFDRTPEVHYSKNVEAIRNAK